MLVSPITQEKIDIIKAAVVDDKPLVIVPHDNPDCDAIISSCLLHIVLEKHGIPTLIALRTKEDKISMDVIEKEKLFYPANGVLIRYIPVDAKLILSDWFKIPDNNTNEVVAVFDHHPTTQEIKGEVVFEENYTSTSKLIYDLFIDDIQNYSDYLIDAINKNVLFVEFLDSNSTKSSRFNPDDNEWIDCMIEKYGYDRGYLVRVGYCLNDLNAPVRELALSGEKNYVLPNGKRAFMSYIMVMDYDGSLDEALAVEMENIRREKDVDYAWNLICDMGQDKTFVYKLSREDEGVGVWDRYDENLSRAKDVYPMLEKMNLG